MFITFEGCEGCGKSTQIKLLKKNLVTAGYQVVMTREPGGTAISDKIREILLDASNSKMKSETELLLYCASRAQHIQEVIKPALDKGSIVLCDRFADATVAYQHFGRGIKRENIEMLNRYATGGLNPDLTILLDGDAGTLLKRAKKRIASAKGPKEERFEQEGLTFHERVRNGYRQLAMNEPHRIMMIDAERSISEIQNDVKEIAVARLSGRENVV